MSLRQGPDRRSISRAQLEDAGFVLPDEAKPAPACVAATTITDVEPTGAFSGRTAAELRAFKLNKGAARGMDAYAHQIKGKWCVVRGIGERMEYVEG